jgi:hypothetical protein
VIKSRCNPEASVACSSGAASHRGEGVHGLAQRQVIAIVDDDAVTCEPGNDLLDSAGDSSVLCSSAQAFLKSKLNVPSGWKGRLS